MKILATSSVVGSAGAIIPVLKVLAGRRHGVLTFAVPESLGWTAFKEGGFQPKTPALYGEGGLVEVSAKMLAAEKPDIVIGGQSYLEESSERAVLGAAVALGIPAVAILECRPHSWFSVWGDRDFSLYSKLSGLFVPDATSVDYMVRNGFKQERVFGVGNPVWEGRAVARERRDYFRSEGRKKFDIPNDAVVVAYMVTNDHDDPVYRDIDHPEYLGCDEVCVTMEYLTAMRQARIMTDRDEKTRQICGIIRQKPGLNDGAKTVRALIDLLCPGIPFDVERKYKDEPAMYFTLCAADVVVGHNSLAVTDAELLGTPGVYYVPALQESGKVDPQSSVNDSGVTIPFHKWGMLRGMILELARNSASALQRLREATRLVNLVPDASKNIADEIEHLAERR